MVKVHKYSVGEMQSNCYLLEEDGGCIIIDPGDDGDYISNKIIELNLKPELIASTHGHLDHNMAAYEITKNFNIPFCISKKDVFLIKKMKESAKLWFKRNDILIPEITLIEKNTIKLGNIKIDIIEIPGHTPGGIAYYIKSKGIMFSGDLIFEGGGLGRVDFKYSNKQDFVQSLKTILNYSGSTMIYPGHGEEFRLSEFKN